MGTQDFYYKIHVTVDKEFKTQDENITLEQFDGGFYAVMKSQYRYNGAAWNEFIAWVSNNKEYELENRWFFEEYKLDKPEIDLDTDMVLHMPVKKRG